MNKNIYWALWLWTNAKYVKLQHVMFYPQLNLTLPQQYQQVLSHYGINKSPVYGLYNLCPIRGTQDKTCKQGNKTANAIMQLC